MPSSIRSAPAAAAASPASRRGLERGVAAHQVRHQRRALAVRREGGRDPVDARWPRRSSRSSSASTSARSLSPRPGERQQVEPAGRGSRAARPARARARAPAGCPRARSRAGRRRARPRRARRRSARGPLSRRCACSGPTPGVVEPRRDRVRLEDLALLVLQHRRHRAVQHPARAGGERRRVAPRLEPLARGLDADQLDARRRPRSAANVPIALEPPPTQAITRSGRRPAGSSTWARASSPIVRCRSRTSAG